LRVIHAHDNRGQYDDHLPPGRGKINWEAWWQELAGYGFLGPIVLEIAGQTDPHRVLEDAKYGIDFLRRLTDERPAAQILPH
jgi:sugar phosphate isomerase/epimerase